MKILIIDLTNQTIEWRMVRKEAIAQYLGGRGLGVRYLYDYLPPNIDPLGPENILSFWTSPIMSTGALSTVKVCGVTKSPATNTILMSLMGGYFGPRMRFAGVDGIILKGVAREPVYLVISEGEASLHSAAHLWGKTTRETESILKTELGFNNMQIASIGPAGENLVNFAAIMHGGDAMGRGGIGAVMGSKNLKAVAVHGSHLPEVADPSRLKAVLKKLGTGYRESETIKLFGQYGTTSHVDDENYFGIYPTRNYRSAKYEDYELVNAEKLYSKFVNHRVTCFTCVVRCRRESEVKQGPLAGAATDGPEYETLWSFGGNCGNPNLEAIIEANRLCMEYGLDTISTGMVISFAMECLEEGIIDQAQTDGLSLEFGDSDSIVGLIHRIAHREGLGEILAQGTRRAAQLLGKGAERYAMEVKGLELAGYDPRGAKGMALGYATSPRGGCHERGFLPGEVFGTPPGVRRLDYEGKGKLVRVTQDTVAVRDSLGFCVLSSAGMSVQSLAEMYSAVTGIETNAEGLLLAGERIWDLERMFNIREGFTRKDDTLPKRLLEEPIPGPNGEPQVVDLERLLDDYYHERGWNVDGVPTQETLDRLGLGSTQSGSQVFEKT